MTSQKINSRQAQQSDNGHLQVELCLFVIGRFIKLPRDFKRADQGILVHYDQAAIATMACIMVLDVQLTFTQTNK